MTEKSQTNIHATAIVLGSRGLLFVGPSGVGKSSSALSCLASAKERGVFNALIGDDQVFLLRLNGRLIAKRPAAIAGLAEVRGSGIVAVPSIQSAVIDCAILPIRDRPVERLAPEHETYSLPDGSLLPLFRLPFFEGMQTYDVLRLVLPKNLLF